MIMWVFAFPNLSLLREFTVLILCMSVLFVAYEIQCKAIGAKYH